MQQEIENFHLFGENFEALNFLVPALFLLSFALDLLFGRAVFGFFCIGFDVQLSPLLKGWKQKLALNKKIEL